MPEVREFFPEVEKMEVHQLHARREELLASAPEGEVSKLSDDALSELLAVTRGLRKKAASPGTSGRKRSGSTKKTAVPLSELA